MTSSDSSPALFHWLRAAANALRQDVGFAVRALSRSAGFTLATVLSLALGIGANTALFSVVNAILLRPLPYKDADRLVILWNRSPGLDITEDWFSTAQYFDIKSSHSGFEEVAIALGAQPNLTGDGEPERVGVMRASSNLLPMLGADAALGRLFLPDEDAPGRPATAVLTHGMWARRYGSDSRVVGRSIQLNGQPFQVIGVLPQSFSLRREVLPLLYGGEQPDIILPLPLTDAAPRTREREDYNILGRLRPGISLRQAQAEMDAVTARLRRDYPDVYPPNGGLTFSIVPLLEQAVGDVRRPLYLLLASVGFLLLVVCANVANLLLARAVARRKEIAVRTALGAGRARLVAQLLTESVLLAVLGGAAGFALSFWFLDSLHVLGSASIPRLPDIRIDGRVLLFTFLASALTGILFGLVPASRITRVNLTESLKEAGRDSAGVQALWGRGNNVRRLLVVSELALSVVLLIGAGLLVRSFAALQSVRPGFNPRNLLTFGLTMTGRQYGDSKKVLETYRRLWERLDALPGVVATGGTTALPLSQAYSWTPISIEGRIPPAGEKFINTDERVVGGRYFQAMEIPLNRGRFFDQQDTPDKPGVVIIDERMAGEFWPGQDPIGKRLRHGGVDSKSPWLTVVGVVGRVKHDTLDSDPRIAMYLPHTQFPVRPMTVVLRSLGDAGGETARIRRVIRDLDPDLPVYQVRTMEQFVQQSLARRRFSTLLLGVFASLALCLAAVGVYGVMAYLVSQGAREIGIRMALGATRGRILRLVLFQGMGLALWGVAVGLSGAFLLSRFMKSLLFGITATDAFTFSIIPGVLLMIALLACYVPARRATSVDPISSLRCD